MLRPLSHLLNPWLIELLIEIISKVFFTDIITTTSLIHMRTFYFMITDFIVFFNNQQSNDFLSLVYTTYAKGNLNWFFLLFLFYNIFSYFW